MEASGVVLMLATIVFGLLVTLAATEAGRMRRLCQSRERVEKRGKFFDSGLFLDCVIVGRRKSRDRRHDSCNRGPVRPGAGPEFPLARLTVPVLSSDCHVGRMRFETTATFRTPLVSRIVIRHIYGVIVSFQHKGLERLYRENSQKDVQAAHVKKLRRLLSALDVAQAPEDLMIPSFKTHRLQGANRRRWSIWVNGNWRVAFQFAGADVELAGYGDYR